MTISRIVSSLVPASVRPIKKEWKTTPNSRISSAVSWVPYLVCESPLDVVAMVAEMVFAARRVAQVYRKI